LSIGISKRALLEDYYPGELAVLFAEYNVVHSSAEAVEEEHVGALAFLGGLG